MVGRRISFGGVALVLVAAAHGIFAWQNRDRRPDLAVVTQPPTAAERQALSFGDAQFLYRAWGLDLQNAGDTGGRATPMRRYNYDYVMGWLDALQTLDARSQFHTFLAAHYFSQTPNAGDVRRMVAFIVQDAAANPTSKWQWFVHAAVMAQRQLEDLPLALRIAEQMAAYDLPDVPPWARMFPAVILEKMSRKAEARALVEHVLSREQNTLSPQERAWGEDFIQQLLKD
jgi:hypothetical protein